jgi:3-oxoacyl-[acyl-carrier-protein] synthase III
VNKHTTIRVIRGYLPSTVLTNEQLAPEVGWSAAEILEKTGIAERRIASPEECASDLAISATKKLLVEANIDPLSIELLIVCTQTPDHFLPSTSCLVHAALGLPVTCAAFDINQGCSGYIYALATAHGWIAGGLAKRGLVITADTYTKLIHPGDRSVRTLFGDGAAATLIEASSEPGLSAFVLGTDGAGAGNLIVPAGGMRSRCHSVPPQAGGETQENLRSHDHLLMNGPEIFAFSLRRVPELVGAVMEAGQVGLDAVDQFIFHQANRYMLNHLRKKLRIPASKMPMFHEKSGNTVSSTIPLLLEHCIAQKSILPGQLLLLAGFGVGYSWGGCLLRWHGK